MPKGEKRLWIIILGDFFFMFKEKNVHFSIRKKLSIAVDLYIVGSIYVGGSYIDFEI